jgi:DNA-binding GntR family transcriptional regulator
VVLVAQDRVHDLARLAVELAERRGERVLVLDGHERHVDAPQARRLRPPDPGAQDDGLGADRAERRLHAAHAAALDDEPGRLAAAERPQPARRGGRAAHRLGAADRLGDPVVGDEQPAEDAVGVDERDALADLGRSEQRGVQPEAERAAVAARELGPALLGRRDLDAADRVEARQPVELERAEQRARGLRELRHRRRRVELEDEPGGVRRRAARLPQRPLVDHHQVGPALADQMMGHRGARDAGPDDHRARRLGESGGVARRCLRHGQTDISIAVARQPRGAVPPARDGLIADRAYIQLRDRIVTLRLAPGSALREDALMGELALGRTPLREAVKRLALEGLVEVRPRSGTYVTEVEANDIVHIAEVRAELEAQAARLAAKRVTPEQRAAAAGMLAEIDAVAESSGVGPAMDLDERVHRFVWEAAANPYLTDALERFWALSLRIWHLVLDRVPTLPHAVHEQRDVLDAVLAGDPRRAGARMRQHVQAFEAEILEAFRR